MDNLPQKIKVTHPFHPLFRKVFKLVAYRRSWRNEYIDCHDENMELVSFPINWTDAGEDDPFVTISAGRAFYRVEDLSSLAEMIEIFSKST